MLGSAEEAPRRPIASANSHWTPAACSEDPGQKGGRETQRSSHGAGAAVERGARRPEAITVTRGGQRSPRPCPFLPHQASPAELPSWVQGHQGRSRGQGAHLGGQVGRTRAGGKGGRVVVTLHQKERWLGGLSRGAQWLSQQEGSWSQDPGRARGQGPRAGRHSRPASFRPPSPGAAIPRSPWGCRGRQGGRGGGARMVLLGPLPSPLTASARARLLPAWLLPAWFPGAAPSRWGLGRGASCFCDLWAASASHPAFQHLCAGKQSPERSRFPPGPRRGI